MWGNRRRLHLIATGRCDASEWHLRERRAKDGERMVEVREQVVKGEEQPPFYPTPSFMESGVVE